MRPATLPRRQVVRHLTLTQAFGGSNPSGAATFQKARSDGSGLLRLRPSVSRVPRYGRQRGGVRRGPAAVRNAVMPARGWGRSSIHLPLSAPVPADAMPSPSRRGCRDVPMVALPPRTAPHETPCGGNPAANRPAQTPRDRIHAGRVPTPCIRHAIPFRYRPRSVPAPSPPHETTGIHGFNPTQRRGEVQAIRHPETSIESMPGSAPMPRIEPPSHSIQTPRWSRSPRSTGRQELHGFAPHPRDAAKHRNPDGGKRASSPRAAMRPRRGSGSGSVIPFDANAVRSRALAVRTKPQRPHGFVTHLRNAARRSNPGIRKRGAHRQRQMHARASAA